MKVIFIPDYRKGNPYQKLLADSLVKEGVDIYFSSTFSLLSILNQKPDILHIHWPHPFLIARSRKKTVFKSAIFTGKLILLKLFGIKIVWTVHNIVNHERKFSSLELFFSKILTKLCNKLIVHCPSAKEEVIKVYGVSDSSIAVIPHGNYIQIYKNEISKAQARKQLQLSPEFITFLHFGQIRPYKGVLELIEAFKKLNYPQAKLLIAGRPLNNEVANAVMRRCIGVKHIRTIFKFIPDDEIQIYMNAADIIVLPYRDILTSGAVILAMSFGKPVIAPAIGCIPDVLDSEGSILYDPSEKESLLKAMKQALDADLKKMGEHNFGLAKHLRWDKIAKRTYEVYQECLKEKEKEELAR